MSAQDMFIEARIRVLGRACHAAMFRGDDESARRIWADYKAAHAMRSPEAVAAMERRMGVA